MKFKLGQKVKYKRISKKIEIDMQFWTYDDFKEDEKKELARRETFELDKERIGYILGRRRLTFKTILEAIKESSYDYYEPDEEYVAITGQEYKKIYLIAYTMGKTNYVLEEDIIPIINSNDDIYKIEGE